MQDNTPMLQFELLTTDPTSHARRGTLTLNHGVVQTPIFMPVGTYGTVKGVMPRSLDECFEIRVSGIKEQIRIGSRKSGEDGIAPAELLERVSDEVHEIIFEQYQLLNADILAKGGRRTPHPATRLGRDRGRVPRASGDGRRDGDDAPAHGARRRSSA